MRRSLAVAACLVFMASMAFAGGTQEQSSSSTAKTNLTFGFWGSPSEVQDHDAVIQAFEAQNPNISVTDFHAPWGDYFTKLQTMFAAKTAPDVMFLTYISTYAPTGVLEDLDPYFSKYNFDISQYPKGLMTSFTIDGKIYGVPRDNDTKMVFYNKALFDAAGVAYPTKGWSIDDFIKAAQKLTDPSKNQYGVVFDPGNWFVWVYMNRGPVFDNLGHPTKIVMNDPSTVAAIQLLGDLINKYKVAPSYDQLNDQTIRTQMFLSGRAAMMVDNMAQVPTLLQAKDLQWNVGYLPVFPGKPMTDNAGGAGFTMYSGAKDKAAAWKLWSFLNTDGVKMYMKSGTIVPSRTDLLNSPDFRSNRPFDTQVIVDETQAGITYDQNPYWWTVYSKANPFLEAVWVGSSTAQQAVDKSLPTLQGVLSSSN